MTTNRYISLNRFVFGSIILLVTALLPILAQGQDKRDPDRGFVAGGSYALSNIETINTTNGNLVLNIPLATLPAGRGPGYTFALRYDSKIWDNKGTHTTDGQKDESGEDVYFSLDEVSASEKGGWHYSSFYRLEVLDRLALEPIPTCGTPSDDYQKSYYKYKVKMNFPDGSVHEFRPLGQSEFFPDGYFAVDPNGRTYTGDGNNCTSDSQGTTSGMTYYSTDGSFLRLVVDYVSGNNGSASAYNPWTLYFPDGSKATNNSTYGQKQYDRNGNWGNVAEDSFGRGMMMEIDSEDSTKHYVKQKGVNGEW